MLTMETHSKLVFVSYNIRSIKYLTFPKCEEPN